MRFVAPAPSPISDHRLARLITWARLWLEWLLGCIVQAFGERGLLPRDAEHAVRRWLKEMAHTIACLIYLRVSSALKPYKSSSAKRPRNTPRGFALHTMPRNSDLRVVMGSALRRALRGGDARALLAKLLRIIRDQSVLCAKLAKRLARGFTRTRRLVASAPPAMLLTPHLAAPCAALADTS
ncbi:MAG: hypothetical protein WDM79_00365 [Terricaulis sp.]